MVNTLRENVLLSSAASREKRQPLPVLRILNPVSFKWG